MHLDEDYNRSIPWIRKQIFEYEPVEKTHTPRAVVIVCDATFYGKKKDKLGTLIFKDILLGEVLIWKHVQSELAKDYKQLLQRILDLGYEVKAIIIDGKRGLYKALRDYPVQMCHFHQKKVIQRYMTMHPRLEAGKDLQKIMYNLTSTTQTIFTNKLNDWHEKHKYFLAERTINPDTLKESFTHQKLVSAYRSLKTNLPYLFTYKKHKKIKINNTTNAIDGGVFSPMTRCPLRVKSYSKYTMDLVKV
ncbi:MAG: transposase [Sulfurimonas sp.]|nr:MAG: transposase [Sulfurimonas sp.]